MLLYHVNYAAADASLKRCWCGSGRSNTVATPKQHRFNPQVIKRSATLSFVKYFRIFETR